MGLVLFVVWLARFSVARNYDIYDMLFHGPVRGLSNGGEVHFNGIKVGEVTDIELDPSNTTRVIATVRLTTNVPVKVDSRAQLEPQGITGVNYIQITAGRLGHAAAQIEAASGHAYPVIHSQAGPLERTAGLQRPGHRAGNRDAGPGEQGPVEREHPGLHRDAAATSRRCSEAMKAHTAVLDKAEAALENASEAAKQLAELSKSGRSLLEGDGARTLKNAADATAEIDAAAKDVRALTAKLKAPTTRFAGQGLPELTAAAGVVAADLGRAAAPDRGGAAKSRRASSPRRRPRKWRSSHEPRAVAVLRRRLGRPGARRLRLALAPGNRCGSMSCRRRSKPRPAAGPGGVRRSMSVSTPSASSRRRRATGC